MKKTITLSILLAAASVSFAQTAKNFTATDCGGKSHTLYDELDKGKVVVVSWVMPCGACIDPSKTAYDAVQSYAANNPGKVLFYVIDDYGDSPCSDLELFASKEIGDKTKMNIFANTGNTIKMSEYGGSGMPKVLVAAGKDHKIFFDKKNAAADDATGIKKAIDSAIVATNVSEISNELKFVMSPNPVAGNLTITYAKEIKKIVITSVSGQVVLEQSFPNGQINPVINMSQLKSAIYMVRIVDMQDREGLQKIMKQ
jgi:hypothetical protein